MTIRKGVNSNVTLSEAELYFEGRLDAAAWNSADDTLKEQALITATSILNEEAWTGVVVSETQNGAFPRVGSYFDPRMGGEVIFDSEEAPSRIKEATYELAYHMLNNDGLLDETGSVIDIVVGPIELTRIRRPAVIPDNVRRKIKPVLINGGSNIWFRAN